MSAYVVSRQPNKYGGQQKEYEEQVERKEIPETVAKIRQAVDESRDIEILFHDILSTLASDRQDLATSHETEEANLFGLRRDQEDFAVSFGTMLTPIGGAYHEYNQQWLPRIQEQLRKINPHSGLFQKITQRFAFGECLDRKDSMELLIFKDSELTFLEFDYSDYLRLCELSKVPVQVSRENYSQVDLSRLCKDRHAMERLKKASLKDYTLLKLKTTARRLRQLFPKSFRSHWSLVTMRLSVNGTIRPLSQYITWMCVDPMKDAIDRMTRESITMIIHQDPFLIKDMLQDVARVFKEAILWNPNTDDVKTLKDRVALITYELSHAMPFYRGSAAIAEWIEMAIYQYHGFTLRYLPEKLVNLEALTLPLHEFMQKYDSLIELR